MFSFLVATYSNLENHPRVIRVRESRGATKIHLDAKTGLPFVLPSEAKNTPSLGPREKDIDNAGVDHARKGSIFLIIFCTNHYPPATRATISRPKNESKEDKRARKHAVKEERQARRADKKAMKETFSNEKKYQLHMLATTENKGMRKL